MFGHQAAIVQVQAKFTAVLTTPYATHTETNSQMELYKEMYACSPGPLLGGLRTFSIRPGNLHITRGSSTASYNTAEEDTLILMMSSVHTTISNAAYPVNLI